MPERAQPAVPGLGFHQNSGGTGDHRLAKHWRIFHASGGARIRSLENGAPAATSPRGTDDSRVSSRAGELAKSKGRTGGRSPPAADFPSARSPMKRRSGKVTALEPCRTAERSEEPLSGTATLPVGAPAATRLETLCPTAMTCMAKEAQNSHSTAKSRLACMLLLPPKRSIEDTTPFSRPARR